MTVLPARMPLRNCQSLLAGLCLVAPQEHFNIFETLNKQNDVGKFLLGLGPLKSARDTQVPISLEFSNKVAWH